MEQKVTFYDPHTAGGAMVPLPKVMKNAVKDLAGQTASLEEVLTKLQPIAENLGGTVRVVAAYKYIELKIEREPMSHFYKLISYK